LPSMPWSSHKSSKVSERVLRVVRHRAERDGGLLKLAS
jgi:hypothetical protein